MDKTWIKIRLNQCGLSKDLTIQPKLNKFTFLTLKDGSIKTTPTFCAFVTSTAAKSVYLHFLLTLAPASALALDPFLAPTLAPLLAPFWVLLGVSLGLVALSSAGLAAGSGAGLGGGFCTGFWGDFWNGFGDAC